MKLTVKIGFLVLSASVAGIATGSLRADSDQPSSSANGSLSAPPSYADLADLADQTPLVIRAEPRKTVALPAASGAPPRAGWGRFYVEARTQALIFGNAAIGRDLRYLVDLPLDPRGKPPSLKGKSVVIFARATAANDGELQLVAPDAQLAWNPALEAQLRGVLAQINAADAPPRVTGVREASFSAGNLAGTSETQLLFSTAGDAPVAATVRRSAGAAPQWGVSFGDVIGALGQQPAVDSMAWYRLACFLPPTIPAEATVAGESEIRSGAAADYAYLIAQLGPCPRTRPR